MKNSKENKPTGRKYTSVNSLMEKEKFSQEVINKFNKLEVQDIFDKNNLMLSRIISGSKSGYLNKYPSHLVIFNANVIGEKSGKIWWGDLDINKDSKNLKKISKELEEKLYVLRESDARFGNENKPIKELIKLAVWNTSLEIS